MPINLTTQAGRIREAAVQRRLMATFEKRMRVAVKRELKQQGSAASAGYRARGLDGALSAVDSASTKRMERIFITSYSASMHSFALRTVSSMPKTGRPWAIEYKDAHDELDAKITAWAKRQAAAKVTEINKTTRKMIANTIAGAVGQDAASTTSVAKAIKDVMGTETPDWRADLIARTEMHGSSMQGSLMGAESIDLPLLKVWVSTEDERTRVDHRSADGDEAPLDGTFTVGGELMQYPGDPSASAENVCNCRCVMIYKEPSNE